MKKHSKKINRYLIYFKAIEGFSNSFLCLFDKIMGREKVRKIRLGKTDMLLRTNTPDLKVALSSLYYKEYNDIRCSKPNVIVDAGANIGATSIFFAQKYPDAKVYAIEPEASNFDFLLKNTENYSNIVAVKAALWGTDTQRVVQNRFTGNWGYTVSDTDNEIKTTGQVIECISVPTLMKTYGIEKIDLFKIDIEGGEKSVFENSSAWINFIDIIAVELHDKICMGCSRSFYIATQYYKNFEKHGDKVVAYRDG